MKKSSSSKAEKSPDKKSKRKSEKSSTSDKKEKSDKKERRRALKKFSPYGEVRIRIETAKTTRDIFAGWEILALPPHSLAACGALLGP